jgi:very-short-patch-repair endonuclease
VTKADLNDCTAKNPDLTWIDKYGMWIVEVDGAVHDRKVEKTNQRNELFRSNNIKLIVVNLAELKELELDIYDYIDNEILRLIKNE